MKKLFANLQNLKTQAGFTMIELLIVIAILGILAVAVLSAINPIEQINRGRDTGSRSDAEQLLSAIDRFNAFQGYYPWRDGASDDVTTNTVENGLVEWSDEDLVIQNISNCYISDLLAGGSDDGSCTGADELKATFFTRILDPDYNHLSIYNQGGQGDSTYVCFVPKSKAFITESEDRCDDALGSVMPSDLSGILVDLCGGFQDPDVDTYICLP